MFADESGERLRKMQVVARFCVVGIVVVGTIVVACLASGVSLLGPDLPGFRASVAGDDHRSVTPERSSADDEHPGDDVSPSAGPASTTPTPTPTPSPSEATPSATPTAESSTAPTSPRARPSHDPGTPPTSPPGKSK